MKHNQIRTVCLGALGGCVAFGLLSLLSAAWPRSGDPSPAALTATSLRLVDESGRLRALLSSQGGDTSFVIFGDTAGNGCAELRGSKGNGGSLTIEGSAPNQGRVALDVREGTSNVILYAAGDPLGSNRVTLSGTASGGVLGMHRRKEIEVEGKKVSTPETYANMKPDP